MKAGFLEECSDALVTMYAKCGLLTKAKEILNTYPSRDVLSWTALISGYAQKGLGKDALDYFEKMQGAGLSPDAVTFACILKACGSIGAADKGERIHDEIAYQGLLESDVVLGTALVDMYAKCGALGKAQQVFQKLFSRNVITWSALITGYCQHGEGAKAFECYEQMQCENLFPDAKTYACILKACGDIRELDKGEKIHDEILRQGLLDNDIVLGTALVYMYAQCGVLIKAQETFNRLPYRDVTSWSALIEGYTQHGQCEKAMEYFEQMRAEGISPNVVTFTSMLKACAAVGAIAKGEKIHDEISKEGLLGSSILLDTALVDMYAKCGVVSRAHKVLNGLYSRDISTWAALIAGYAQQGHCEQAIICLEQMQEEGLSPDHTIFSSLLNACSHLGRVDEGHMYFALLTKRFGVKPDLEHYTCIVDLLGRAGHIDKAVRVIQEMPYSNNIEVWSALLAACRQWGNTYIGKWAFEHAVQLDKKNTAAYVIMADLYASAAMREDAKGIQVLGVENEA
ncbi:hypothetical protein KP509_22G079900 [Ceratopteris richardii]|nr:hypothetical protein KP509_22G079900 [Ceratopteris richardii]